jgi:hypothetical protein
MAIAVYIAYTNTDGEERHSLICENSEMELFQQLDEFVAGENISLITYVLVSLSGPDSDEMQRQNDNLTNAVVDYFSRNLNK